MIYLFKLFDIVFAVSIKIWVLVSCFSIYFTHFFKCLSKYFLFRQVRLLARLRKSDWSPHLSLLEDNSRRDQLYIIVTMWPIWPTKYNTSTQTAIFKEILMLSKKNCTHGGNPFWDQKRRRKILAFNKNEESWGGITVEYFTCARQGMSARQRFFSMIFFD